MLPTVVTMMSANPNRMSCAKNPLNPEVTIDGITTLSTSSVQFNGGGGAIEVGTISLTNTKNQTSTIEIKPSGYVQITD